MAPSSTVHAGQHDTKYVTFELLLHAAFAADKIGVICLNQLVQEKCRDKSCFQSWICSKNRQESILFCGRCNAGGITLRKAVSTAVQSRRAKVMGKVGRGCTLIVNICGGFGRGASSRPPDPNSNPNPNAMVGRGASS